ncbi:MAG: hypothetical protein AB7P14_22180 [Blastocatellales bacterium]
MLPLGVYTITQIEQERNPATQVIQLVSLLEFLLGFVSPNQLSKDGEPATVGERVDANRNLFSNPPDVFYGIGVRNNIIHAKSSDATESEIRRAAMHLFKAINELRRHENLPEIIRQEIFKEPQTELVSVPTGTVSGAQLPTPPPKPNFAPISQTAPTNSMPLSPAMVSKPVSYTTRVSPKQTVPNQNPMATSSEPSISTRQIRNIAIVIGLIAAVVFLAKPVWYWSKERIYGSEENTKITRTQAESALKTIQGLGKKPGLAAKVIEAQTAWRDAEIAFNQGKFKEAEPIYRRVLEIGDEMALRETERKDTQQFFDDMNKAREAARAAQAQQYAASIWIDAENLKRSADLAFKNGDIAVARQTALQAQQKYEEAKSVADTTPKQEPSPTPTPSSPTPNDPPLLNDQQRLRPRPDSPV